MLSWHPIYLKISLTCKPGQVWGWICLIPLFFTQKIGGGRPQKTHCIRLVANLDTPKNCLPGTPQFGSLSSRPPPQILDPKWSRRQVFGSYGFVLWDLGKSQKTNRMPCFPPQDPRRQIFLQKGGPEDKHFVSWHFFVMWAFWRADVGLPGNRPSLHQRTVPDVCDDHPCFREKCRDSPRDNPGIIPDNPPPQNPKKKNDVFSGL